MKGEFIVATVSLVMTFVHPVLANGSDVEEGGELYAQQCQSCHGALDGMETGYDVPFDSPLRTNLAMLDSQTSDTGSIFSGLTSDTGCEEAQLVSLPTHVLRNIAMAPNGPALRGVVGRRAASIEGYTYSKAMVEKLKDVVWTEDNLDRLITNTQAWVPRSFMLYKQADAEIRRKVILYLKANP